MTGVGEVRGKTKVLTGTWAFNPQTQLFTVTDKEGDADNKIIRLTETELVTEVTDRNNRTFKMIFKKN